MTTIAKSSSTEAGVALLLSGAGLMTTKEAHAAFDKLRAHSAVRSLTLNPKSRVALTDQVRAQLPAPVLQRLAKEALPLRARSMMQANLLTFIILLIAIAAAAARVLGGLAGVLELLRRILPERSKDDEKEEQKRRSD